MSADRAERIVASAAPKGATGRESALAVRWLTTALTEPLPPRDDIVEGMLAPGELVVLGAPRAIGKSWLAKNAAVLVGRGEGYLGGALRVARSARVLVCHGEIDAWEAARRWRMLTGGDGAPDNVAETFDRWRLRTVRKRSSSGGSDDSSRWSESDEWVDAHLDGRLEETIAEHKFEVLIIDPWAVFYSGSENSNDEVEAGLDKLRDLALRYGVAVWILHHLGKATDAREPEDLWRGASRLADWASTRITLLPHYSERQAEQQGMTRQQARRYVDVRFLRRSTPTDDFSMRLDAETGWWERWKAPEAVADGRRVHLDIPDVIDACRASGGAWKSQRAAADALGVAATTAGKLLSSAVRCGALEAASGERGATIYRLPGNQLEDGQ
ncbi:MAG: AAA family ATPase [Actinomycetota bacterium]|nr:AAA family ATPase [Actinomycetota bacterium]